MFAPVFHDDDDDNEHDELHDDGQFLIHWLPQFVVPMAKINNVLLLLSLGVATFLQFSTLEPRYLNALLWGEADDANTNNITLCCEQEQEENAYMLLSAFPEEDDEPSSSSESSSNLLLLMRTLQSMAAILLLSVLRAVIFPNLSGHTTRLEAVLGDMLFHIQCRLLIGCCMTCLALPVPFDMMEATVVCLSMALQQIHHNNGDDH